MQTTNLISLLIIICFSSFVESNHVNCPNAISYTNGSTSGFVTQRYRPLADLIAYFSNNDIFMNLPVDNPDGTSYMVNTSIPRWRGQVAINEGEDSCLVINLASGLKYMNGSSQHIGLDDIVVPYSCSKFEERLAAIIAIDQKYFKLKDTIASKLPGFGINGKSATTFGNYLSNRAGLASSGTSQATPSGIQFTNMLTLSDLNLQTYNATHTLQNFKNATPRFNIGGPGTEVAYNTLEIGNNLADIIQYLDPTHRNLTQFILDEWANPIGINDVRIGVDINDIALRNRMVEISPGFFPLRNDTRYQNLISNIFSIEVTGTGTLGFNSLFAFPDFADSVSTGINPLTGLPRSNPANDPVYLNTFTPAIGFMAPASVWSKLNHVFANDGMYRNEKIVRKSSVKEAFTPVLLSNQDQTLFEPMCITNVGVWCKTSSLNVSLAQPSLDHVYTASHPGAAGSVVLIDRNPDLPPVALTILTAQYSTGTGRNPFFPENVNQMIQTFLAIRQLPTEDYDN